MLNERVIKNIWYVAGWLTEFDNPGVHSRLVAQEPIVIFRSAGGDLVALEDRCAHRWAPLSKGRVEGGELRCMYHGVRYAADGKAVEVPGQDKIAPGLCVKAYPVATKHRLLWVWLGDPAIAEITRVPDLGLLDREDVHLNCGSIDYRAHFSLINDNLLDLSHIAILHENSLGRRVEEVGNEDAPPPVTGGMDARLIEDGVRFDSWSDLRYRTVIIAKKFRRGEMWNRTDYLVPGLFLAHWRIYPEGTAEACDGQEPGPEHEILGESFSIQAVVPMTRRSSRYFFSLGHGRMDMDPDEAESIWSIVRNGFVEDLDMIEAQQRVIDDYPRPYPMAGIAADRGLVMFRNLMNKLLDAELQ
jgi:vanillate O-demethylase monooxygenase subunit